MPTEIAKSKQITSEALANVWLIEKSNNTIEEHIAKLKADCLRLPVRCTQTGAARTGRLERIGSDRDGYCVRYNVRLGEHTNAVKKGNI